jgi:hypothetical protein
VDILVDPGILLVFVVAVVIIIVGAALAFGRRDR